MAKANVTCTCTKCGKSFTISKSFSNRGKADSFETYAQTNYTECPDCYKARMRADTAEKAAPIIAKYEMPEITGKSESQINYAVDKRNTWLANATKTQLDSLDRYLAVKNTEPYINLVRKTAESLKCDEDKANDYLLGKLDIKKLVKLLDLSDAATIIDLL